MLKFIKKIVNSSTLRNRLAAFKSRRPVFYFQKHLKMASESSKTKSDLNLDENPVKKIKLSTDMSKTRTVATMCGAWRPEEEDGGMVLVFKTRKECLSPDPEKESDFPENIEDFWDAASLDNNDIQENTYKHYYYPDEASDDDSDLALKVKKAISKRPNSIHSFFEKRKKRKTVQKSSTVSQATADGVGFIKTNEDDETFASHLIKIEVYEMSKIKNIPSTDQWKKAEVRVKYYASCDEDKNLQSARDVIYNITKQIANRKDCVNYFIDGEKQVQM